MQAQTALIHSHQQTKNPQDQEITSASAVNVQTRMDLQQEIAALNHNAIQVLLQEEGQGDLQQALVCFARALILVEQLELKETDETFGDASLDRTNINMNVSTNALWSQPGIPNLDLGGRASSGSLFLYNKPIPFGCTCQEDATFLRAALLFNSALTYHSLSVQTNNVSHLQNAISIYDMSFQTFLSVSGNQIIHHNNEYRTQWLMLASWNNQAVIHFEGLGNQRHAMDMLQGQTMLVVDLYQRLQPVMTFVGPILQEFSLNEYMVRTGSMPAPMA